MRRRTTALLAVTATAGALCVPADASTQQTAKTKARKAANHYTNTHFGIGFEIADGWRHWTARCTRRSAGGWRCTVSMEGGQCMGSLKLTRALTPFGYNIGCLE
jgi:hypothetical protein